MSQMDIDVRGFLYKHINRYNGTADFLQGPTQTTKQLWEACTALLYQERERGGVWDIDTKTIATSTSHSPGYIDKDNELIVGLQTDQPLKRAIKPFGGRRVVQKACDQYGASLSSDVIKLCTAYRKTHNDGVFSAYTPHMRALRKSGVITGLPDNYARGRIIGDYRRVALYGIDKLIQAKQTDLDRLVGPMHDTLIRKREEVSEQIAALEDIKKMAESYGYDISQPAVNAQEAMQRTYFGFLAAIKEQDGAAMSLGAVSSFFDIFIERDIKAGLLNESSAQELIDQFVIKLRLVRQLRPEEYSQLFAGDPTRTTEAIGGMFEDGSHKVTKTSFRMLQTLYNLGPSPEPNITVLWSPGLPEGFKQFCAQVSIDTSAIQYENDDLMKHVGAHDDYGIACCVSQMALGKRMQFFGARCNIAKALLYAINEGKDEMSGETIIPGIPKLTDEVLSFEVVKDNFEHIMEHIAESYVQMMNIIHYMHDKYYYERSQMALIDTDVHRQMAFGLAGLSVAADSLSAIRYGETHVTRDKHGISTGFTTNKPFPVFGNDDDEVDQLAVWIVERFYNALIKHTTYRNAEHTLSILTITSNVYYGKKTGATPDGRQAGKPFAPGANPMHGRDTTGVIASLNSVAKLPYVICRDGISNTITLTPQSLGAGRDIQVTNLVQLLDGYFKQGAQHVNINVLQKAMLEDAMEHPDKYPSLTIRVSGYAVHFTKLSKEHQKEVISRTFHGSPLS